MTSDVREADMAYAGELGVVRPAIGRAGGFTDPPRVPLLEEER